MRSGRKGKARVNGYVMLNEALMADRNFVVLWTVLIVWVSGGANDACQVLRMIE